ncbi:MAG: hypothetical protein MJZ74_08715 [Muribaculaceae bacterium]|nr:hypothetical protein [Muribaculaceae bacterium]
MNQKDNQQYHRDLQPSMKRRCYMHNYNEPGIYMFTLAVDGRRRLLGRLVGVPSCPHIELTPLGEEVTKCIYGISKHHPAVEVWKHIVMEDHIHVLVCVREKMKHHLGQVIAGLKAGCSKAYWELHPELSLETPSHVPRATASHVPGATASHVPGATASHVPGAIAPGKKKPLFEPGYNDRILSRYGQLDVLKRYIDDNPRRLAVKRAMPHLFKKYLHIVIGKQEYAAYGNIFLLREPEKEQVQVHRRDSDQEHQEHMKQWRKIIENGGVLVSPFISEREKQVRDMAREIQGKLIILKENGFPEYFKPSGWEFNYCATGNLLLLAPWPHHNQHTTITRKQCLSLNDMAKDICNITLEEAKIVN